MGEVYNEKPSSVPPAPATFSTSVTETEDGAHEFTITGYSLLKGMGFGKHVSSSVFTVGKHDWAIYFYPDGKCEEDDAEYVSLFIALASEATDVRALFELKLMDHSGKGEHRFHTNFGRGLEKEPHVLKHCGSMWGYKKFLRRSQLEGSDYLRGDCLQVHCRVGVVRTRIEAPKTYSVAVPPSDIGQHFGQLLESGKETDVTFVVNEEVFPAHKLVLAARSPVFMAQFFGPMKDEAIGSINVDDMEASAFKALLHYMYSDTLPEMYGSASTLMAQHLLAAADKYGLDRLRLLCEAKLCENIAINNVATTLALAEQLRCFPLKSVCLEFASMPENRKAVVQTDGYKYLKESCPSVIHELLGYAAGMNELSVRTAKQLREMDGSDVNGRRVKQRQR